jgi:dTDP-glucose pyrophosphorylase
VSTSRAVILARGLGSRIRAADEGAALTPEQARAADAGLKAMMPIGRRPFLDYLLSAVADAGLRQVALVVAPEHGTVRRYYEEAARPSRLTIDFVVQPRAEGTADAVLAAEAWTRGDAFLVLNGDTLYPAPVLREVAALAGPGLAAFDAADLARTGNIERDRIRAFALAEVDEEGWLRGIVEKPPAEEIERAGAGARVSLNCWRFDRHIFDACRDVPRSVRGEREIPTAVMRAIEQGVRFRAVQAGGPLLDLSQRADAVAIGRRLAGVTPRP